jgi:hypothetical protein
VKRVNPNLKAALLGLAAVLYIALRLRGLG